MEDLTKNVIAESEREIQYPIEEADNELKSIIDSITLENVESLVERVLGAIENGDLSALNILTKMDIIVKRLEDVRKEIMPIAVSELSKFGQKQVPMFGAILSVIETGVKWNYEETQDPVWLQMKDRALEVDRFRKEREMLLKKFADDYSLTEIITPEGEVVERPSKLPTKSSSTIVKVEVPFRKRKKK